MSFKKKKSKKSLFGSAAGKGKGGDLSSFKKKKSKKSLFGSASGKGKGGGSVSTHKKKSKKSLFGSASGSSKKKKSKKSLFGSWSGKSKKSLFGSGGKVRLRLCRMFIAFVNSLRITKTRTNMFLTKGGRQRLLKKGTCSFP